MNFPVSLDDLKNWYYGITSSNTWRRAGDQLAIARNNISNATQPDVTPGHGQVIADPSINLSDVWHKLAATMAMPGKGNPQPQNISGIR